MASSYPELTVGADPVYGINQLSPSATVYTEVTGPYSGSSQLEHAFPGRPGQPECQYYLRTGKCKYGRTCKYHHPPELNAPTTNYVLSPLGLPLRPVRLSFSVLFTTDEFPCLKKLFMTDELFLVKE